jgi:type 1 fimbriae regulatory protein FimB/type 1 fimbriae regulatory protein FimE
MELAQPAKKKKRRQQTIPAYLTEEEISRLLRATRVNPRDRAIFTVCYHRGLRASELGLINLDDYDPEFGRLTIRRLKGSRGGEYPLTHAEKVALGAWLRERDKTPGPLFITQKKRGISRKTLHGLMRRYCEIAHIHKSKAHMHALKHSCGTHLSSQSNDIVGIQDHMGHIAIQNTMKYVQISSKRRMDFAQGLERSGWGLSRS